MVNFTLFRERANLFPTFLFFCDCQLLFYIVVGFGRDTRGTLNIYGAVIVFAALKFSNAWCFQNYIWRSESISHALAEMRSCMTPAFCVSVLLWFRRWRLICWSRLPCFVVPFTCCRCDIAYRQIRWVQTLQNGEEQLITKTILVPTYYFPVVIARNLKTSVRATHSPWGK